MGIHGVGQLVDDNGKGTMAFAPLSCEKKTGVESTTVHFSTTESSLVRIVALGDIHYNVTSEATSVVTNSMTFLPAKTVEYVKLAKGLEHIAFIGSTSVYVTTLR